MSIVDWNKRQKQVDSVRNTSTSKERNIYNSIQQVSPEITIFNEKLVRLKTLVNDLLAEQNVDGPCFIILGVTV